MATGFGLMAAPPIYLPDDFSELVRTAGPKESFWININGVSCSFSLSKASNALYTSTDNYTAELSTTPPVCTVRHESQQVARIQLSTQTLPLNLSAKVTSGDLFANQALVGTEDGQVRWYDLATDTSFSLPGHYVYTSLAKFFPSGLVGLTAGMDYSMKVWDLQVSALGGGQGPVQTLRYQRGMVDNVAFIGRGRNLVSLCRSDKERAVAVWEVGAPAVVVSYAVADANAVAVWDNADPNIQVPDLHNADGKLGLVASERKVEVLDFRQPQLAPLIETGARQLVVNGHLLFSSTETNVELRDLRMARTPTQIWSDPAQQLVAYKAGIAFRTNLGTYTWQEHQWQLVASGQLGKLVGGNDVANIGQSIVKFSAEGS